MYTYMYMCTHVFMHTYSRTDERMHAHTHTHTHTHGRTDTHTHLVAKADEWNGIEKIWPLSTALSVPGEKIRYYT